jgi:hypothetical protein
LGDAGSFAIVRRSDVRAHFLFGPYVRAQVTAPPPAAATRVGLQGSFGGELQVLGRTVASFDQPLFDVGKDF